MRERKRERAGEISYQTHDESISKWAHHVLHVMQFYIDI